MREVNVLFMSKLPMCCSFVFPIPPPPHTHTHTLDLNDGTLAVHQVLCFRLPLLQAVTSVHALGMGDC
jgi:hypothetical protein